MDLFYIVVFVTGVAVGAATGTFWARHKASRIRDKETLENNQLVLELQHQVDANKISLAEAEVRLTEERRHMEEKLSFVSNSREQLKTEFQNLANQILEEKSKVFNQQNRESIDGILIPLREQLGEFRKRTEDLHVQQESSKAALVNEIGHLKSLSLQISEDANHLADALKGESKTQGTWGELQLERLLEMSGLERGREYETQFQTHDDAGERFIPDVIIRLPQSKDVVVDSKVSLTAWELYCSAETEEQRAEALKSHVQSIRRHIQSLSEKRYDLLPEIHSMESTICFVPIEAALITAIKHDASLFTEAFKKNIVLVCPSTLLVTLRVIAFSWTLHHQTNNVQTIALKAGAMVDKLFGFVETMQEVGEAIQKAGERYDSAIRSLSSGKGNLIKRAEELQALGVKGKKVMPKGLIQEEPGEQTDLIEGEAS
jgi:DNA recombination protein RmuC